MLPIAHYWAMSVSYVSLLFTLILGLLPCGDTQDSLAHLNVWLSIYDISSTNSLEHCNTLKLRQASGSVPAAASPLFIVQQVEEAVQLQVAFEPI